MATRLNRDLTITGIAAILSVTENSTDTYGFGESGTETITTGGADAPGTLSFDWDQMGTDDYQIHQGNTSGSSSYGLDLTDTVSSSWQDAGVDALTASDSVTGETDSFLWNQFNSLTDDVAETNGGTLSGEGMQSFSMADTGSETLAADESHSGSLSSPTSQINSTSKTRSPPTRTAVGAGTWMTKAIWRYCPGSVTISAADGYSFDDSGNDSLSGSSSTESDSYDLSDWNTKASLMQIPARYPKEHTGPVRICPTTNS